MKYEFQSGFSGHLKDMLKYRETMGRDTADYQKHLGHFDRFCLKNYPDETTLTQELVFSWCDDARGGGGTKRACVMRNFGRYLSLVGNMAYIIPKMFFPTTNNEPPYMFTDSELKNFFEATDLYPHTRNPLLEYTVPMIFRLQYACGMRPQEVRKLRCIDFNFADNTIYIAEGKHHKDRKLAAGSSIMEMCKKYDRIAHTFMPGRTYFFQSPSGKAYSSSWLTSSFHKCWEMSGNGNERGTCVPFDLRHNYASRTLMRWNEDGKDLNVWIPYLSAYMGHESFKATYYYIHLLPERLVRAGLTRLEGILPEVQYEEST